jgi:3',5'-cyclic AMP phosphodiesterase CpdA
MKKISAFTAIYFKRRLWFRLALIAIIIGFWTYIEIGDLSPIQEHDLNYQALATITDRYENNDRPLTFAFLADSKNSPVFQQVVRTLNSDKSLQFVILGGDLVLYPERDTFKSFLRQRQDLEIPSLALPGNHDVAFDTMDLYYQIFGRMYYSFVLGDSKFILLNNSNEKDLGLEQEAWLEKELQDGQQYTNRFVFMHVPLWDPRDKPGVAVRYAHSMKDPDVARSLEDLFLKYKVTTLFASHIHAYYEDATRGLSTIISGGAGAELVGKDPEHTFYHYVRVTTGKGKVHTEVVKIEKNIKYEGVSKYLSIAALYVKTLGRIYVKYVLIGLFLFVLIIDGLLEYLYQQKQKSVQGR